MDPYDDFLDEELDEDIAGLFLKCAKRDRKRRTKMVVDGQGIKKVQQSLAERRFKNTME